MRAHCVIAAEESHTTSERRISVGNEVAVKRKLRHPFRHFKTNLFENIEPTRDGHPNRHSPGCELN